MDTSKSAAGFLQRVAFLTAALCFPCCTGPNEGVDAAPMAPDGATVHDMAVARGDLGNGRCLDTLSDVAAGDFSIRFVITTKASVTSTVLYQRLSCDARNDFWDVELTPDGRLLFEIGQANVKYSSLPTTVAVNDGQPHRIVMWRADLVVATGTDSMPSGAVAAPEKLGALGPLGIGVGHPCEVVNVKPLAGTVSNICLRKEGTQDPTGGP